MGRSIQVMLAAAVVAMSASVLRGQTLLKVEKESATFGTRLVSDPYEDVIPRTWAGNEEVYRLTFARNEPFVFVVPNSLLILRRPATLFAMGRTPYAYDDDGNPATPPIIYRIPHKLLRIRQALLDAKAHFEAELKRLGIPFAYYKPGEPIVVFVGYFTREHQDTQALTRAWSQEIRIRHDLDADEVETIPIHELFHTLQKIVAATPITLDQLRGASEEDLKLWKAVGDMTCQWATDEPISIRHIVPPGPLNLDTVNTYAQGVWFVTHLNSLFNRDRYGNVHLIKYLAEQVHGGTDTSASREVFRIHQVLGKWEPRDKIAKAIADQLPSGQYPGAWQQKWRRFFRNFCMANVVQRGSVAHNPANVLGYHDDAFLGLEMMCPLNIGGEHYDDYLRRPTEIYPEAAADDAERQRRLATLASNPIQVRGLAHKLYLINFSDRTFLGPDGAPDPKLSWVHEDVKPRTVFLYAKGEAGTDVFALHQGTQGLNYLDRAQSVFVLNPKFAIPDTDRAVFGPNRNVTTEGRRDYIWIGMVNNEPDAEMKEREITWAYAATPGLVPLPAGEQAAGHGRGSPTVRLVGGEPWRRPQGEGFYNGDSFAIEIRSTGLLHVGEDDEDDIPPNRRTLTVELVNEETGVPVRLVRAGGRVLKFSSLKVLPTNLYHYRIEGRIGSDNPVIGRCKARIRWTSLLNLGTDDEGLDESYSFVVRDPQPRVAHVEVRSGQKVIYDSSKAAQAIPPQPTDAEYNLAVKITFSEKMRATGARISAGPVAPYDAYPVAPLVWDADGLSCKGLLTVPVAAGGKSWPVAWLSISGISDKGVRLDTDAELTGDQPDTRHFMLLGARDFYALTFQAEGGAFYQPRHRSDYTDSVRFRPLELKMLAMPRSLPWHDWHFPEPRQIPSELEHYQKSLRFLEETEIPKIKKQIIVCERAMERTKNEPEHTDEAIAIVEARLAELKVKLATAQAEARAMLGLKGGFDALLRVIGGLRMYTYSRDLCGPIAATFRGGRWEHSDYVAYTRQGNRITEYRSLQMDAPPWTTSDIDSIGWHKQGITHDGDYMSGGAELIVWDFDQRDLETLRGALATQTALSRSSFGEGYLYMLRRTAAAMWLVAYPERSRPAALTGRVDISILNAQLRTESGAGFGFPPIINPRLMRLVLDVRAFRYAPLEASGTATHVIRPDDGPPTRRSCPVRVARSFDSLATQSSGGADFGIPQWLGRPSAFRSSFPGPETGWYADAGAAEQVEWLRSGINAPTEVAIYAMPSRPTLFGSVTRRFRDHDGDEHTYHDRYLWRVVRNGESDSSTGAPGIGADTRPGATAPTASGIATGPAGGDAALPAQPTSEPGQPGTESEALKRPGAVTGALRTPPNVKPGRVVVYLTGPDLLPAKPQTQAVDFKKGFAGELLVLPAGSSVRFVNSTSKAHRPVSKSSQNRFDLTVDPGQSKTITFPKPGKFRIRDAAQSGSVLKVVVAPNGHYVEARDGSFRIDGVPPGPYVLHVIAENPSVRSIMHEAVIAPAKTTILDVPLRPRH